MKFVGNYIFFEKMAGDCLITAIMHLTNKTNIEDWENIYRDLFEISIKKHVVFNSPIVIDEYMSSLGFEKVYSVSRDDLKNPKNALLFKDFMKDIDQSYKYLIVEPRHAFAIVKDEIYERHVKEKTPIMYYYRKKID